MFETRTKHGNKISFKWCEHVFPQQRGSKIWFLPHPISQYTCEDLYMNLEDSFRL